MKTLFKHLIFILLILSSSCGENETNNIYNATVDFKINLRAWDSELRVPLAIKMYTAPRAEGRYIGYGGLLVIASPLNPITPNVYPLYVFDLACPHEQNPNVKIEVDENTEAICPRCNSRFNIIDGLGQKISGPSETGLQRYRAINDNSNPDIFRITR